MDRYEEWDKIREEIPCPFYKNLNAENLEKEIRLSHPILGSKGNYFTPFNQLEQHHRELEGLKGRIQEERDFTVHHQAEFSMRWELAYEKLQDLNQVIDKFESYYKQTQEKLHQDEAKYKEDVSEVQRKCREIRKLHKEYAALQNVQKVVASRLSACNGLTIFLQSIVEHYNKMYNDESIDISEFIGKLTKLRKDKIKIADQVLVTTQKYVDSIIQEDHNKRACIKLDLSCALHNLHLHDYCESLEAHIITLNATILKEKGKINWQLLRSERPKMSINNLYRCIAKRMRQQATLKPSDVRGQLRFIQKFLGEMKKLTEKLKNLELGDDD